MVYKQYKPIYNLLRELLLTLNGVNEIYTKNGGLDDVLPGDFHRETERLIQILDSGNEGAALEVRLRLAVSFPIGGFGKFS